VSIATFSVQKGTANPEKVRSVDADSVESERTRDDVILPSVPSSLMKHTAGDNAARGSTAQSQAPREEASPIASTAQKQVNLADISPLIRLSEVVLRVRQFKVLQQWEGVVNEVHHDCLNADIRDLTNPSQAVEIVDISMDEIPEADQDLLEPGCVFYWIIGHQTSPGGQKSRISEIRVRRNPKWTQHAIDSIKTQGQELYQQFAHSAEDRPTERR
jgi:hypothetical protein